MYRSALLTAAIPAVSVMLMGCSGLIDPSITSFDLAIPERQFTIDTQQWDLSTMETFPAIECTTAPGICSSEIDKLCGTDRCTGECIDELCHLTVYVTLRRTVDDLYASNPELNTINDRPLVEVKVNRVFYTVEENTLNFETPAIQVYVAPQNVMDPNDPQARSIGTIPSVAMNSQPGPQDVELTSDGQAALQQFMSDYRTPFNFILSADIEVAPASDMPSGRITAEVGVLATADF